MPKEILPSSLPSTNQIRPFFFHHFHPIPPFSTTFTSIDTHSATFHTDLIQLFHWSIPLICSIHHAHPIPIHSSHSTFPLNSALYFYPSSLQISSFFILFVHSFIKFHFHLILLHLSSQNPIFPIAPFERPLNPCLLSKPVQYSVFHLPFNILFSIRLQRFNNPPSSIHFATYRSSSCLCLDLPAELATFITLLIKRQFFALHFYFQHLLLNHVQSFSLIFFLRSVYTILWISFLLFTHPSHLLHSFCQPFFQQFRLFFTHSLLILISFSLV